MNDVPPKRFESELTVVIDRDKLPPKPSTIPGPTIEMLDEIARARIDGVKERETQMECPWCLNGLVTPTQRAEWLATYPELTPPVPPDEVA